MKSAARVLGVGVALLVLASACSSSDDESPPPLTAAGNGESAEGLAEVDPVTGNVGFFMPEDTKPTLQPGGNAEQAAVEYLQANGTKLGIPNAKDSYKPIGASKDDDDGTTHVKLQQMSNGIEVWGVVTMVHFDESGVVDAVDGAHIPNLDAIAKQAPAVTDAAAKITAEADARTLVAGTLAVTSRPSKLVIYVDDDYANPRLAWHYRTYIRTADGRQSGEVFVDAMNGAVLDSWGDSSNADEQKEARAEGYDGQPHSTPVVATGGIFRHGRIETKTQSQLIPGRFLGEEGKEEWFNFDKPTLDGPWDRHAVTAMLNIDRAERFYHQELKYEGPSGKRSPILVTVREPVVKNVNAYAFWSDDGLSDTIAFTKASAEDKSPVLGIDVVGHEFTHLVTAYNSKLVYRRQPGAINEAISDIFGAFIERKILGRNENTFLVGEAKGVAWRDMRHPKLAACKKCVDNYREVLVLDKGEKPNGDGESKKYNDQGYVHSNSSIVNNAWALIVEGGTNDTSKMSVTNGIGWDKSIKLWWKTQRHLLTPRMTIRRLARLQAGLSKKSKGRYDPEIVACSWAAVDGVALDWARTKLKVACAQAGTDPAAPNACQGKADGTYCSDPDRFFGYICKSGAVAKGLQCPPPNTHCVGPSPDGQSLTCD